MTGCRARSTFLWVHRNLIWQLSRDGNLNGLPWSGEEMLDGQHQKVDIPAKARTAHKGLLQKRLEEDLSWIIPHVPLMTQVVKGLNWTEKRHFLTQWLKILTYTHTHASCRDTKTVKTFWILLRSFVFFLWYHLEFTVIVMLILRTGPAAD